MLVQMTCGRPVAPIRETVNHRLEQSSVIIPAVLIRFLVLASLFRLNSAKKWHTALDKQLLPEPGVFDERRRAASSR